MASDALLSRRPHVRLDHHPNNKTGMYIVVVHAASNNIGPALNKGNPQHYGLGVLEPKAIVASMTMFWERYISGLLPSTGPSSFPSGSRQPP